MSLKRRLQLFRLAVDAMKNEKVIAGQGKDQLFQHHYQRRKPTDEPAGGNDFESIAIGKAGSGTQS